MEATGDDLYASWTRLQVYEDLEEEALGLHMYICTEELEAALDRARAATSLAQDPHSDLQDQERAVLDYAARKTGRRVRLQFALYVPDVSRSTRLTERETHKALQGLHRKGHLYLLCQGQSEDGLDLYALPTLAFEGQW